MLECTLSCKGIPKVAWNQFCSQSCWVGGDGWGLVFDTGPCKDTRVFLYKNHTVWMKLEAERSIVGYDIILFVCCLDTSMNGLRILFLPINGLEWRFYLDQLHHHVSDPKSGHCPEFPSPVGLISLLHRRQTGGRPGKFLKKMYLIPGCTEPRGATPHNFTPDVEIGGKWVRFGPGGRETESCYMGVF